jgi:hypothetical protein
VCASRVESQSLQPEGVVEGLLLQRECAESKNSNTWKYLRSFRKECVHESF